MHAPLTSRFRSSYVSAGITIGQLCRECGVTFRDQAGQELPAVSAEAGPAFVEYFRESEMGGLFRLTARFPVSGDASKLARVAVRLANGIGAGAGRSE